GTALVFLYPLSLRLYEYRLDQSRKGPNNRIIDREPRGRLGAWFRSRRMYEFPTTVDFEHLLLVVTPVAVLIDDRALPVCVGVVIAFLAAQSLRYFVALLRTGRAADLAEQAQSTNVL